MDRDGAVTGLSFADHAMRLGAAGLAAAVLDAIRAAKAQIGPRYAQAVGASGADEATVDRMVGRPAEVGGEFSATALTGPGDWTGSAHDAYQTMAADVSTAIDACTQPAKGLSVLLTGVAQLVNGVRDLVKTVISELVALIVDAAEALLGAEEQAWAASKVLHLLARLAEFLEYLGPIITAGRAIPSAIDSAWRQYQENEKG